MKTGDRKSFREGESARFSLAGARSRHWSQTESEENSDFFEGAGIAEALMRGLGLGGAVSPYYLRRNLLFSSSSLRSWPLDDRRPSRSRAFSAAGSECSSPLSPPPGTSSTPSSPTSTSASSRRRCRPPRPPSSRRRGFPGSEVDLTVTHPLATTWATLEAAVRAGAPRRARRRRGEGTLPWPWRARGLREDDDDPAFRLPARLSRARGRERLARRGRPAPSRPARARRWTACPRRPEEDA